MKNKKTRNILLISVGAIIILGLGILLGKLIFDKKVENYILNGVVTSIKDGVLTVKEVDTGNFYSVSFTEGEYSIGDTVAVYSKNPIIETYPAQIKSSKIEKLENAPAEVSTLISIPITNKDLKENHQITSSDISYKEVDKSVVTNDNYIVTNADDIIGKYVFVSNVPKDSYFYLDNISNQKKESISSNSNTNTNSNPNNNSNSNGNNNETPITEIKTEADVVTYFNTLNSDLDKKDSSTSFTGKLKSGFVTVVDFLFYGKEIYGYTFSELTSAAKLQVLKAALWIDSKIDKVLPGYKETIGSAYTSVKNKVITAYLDLTTKICTNDPSLCEQAKQDFTQMKESFSLTWDFVKNLLNSGIGKLSDWYLIWKET